ncbi:MAG: arylsulfatase [Verrucomicrobiota bacterium]
MKAFQRITSSSVFAALLFCGFLVSKSSAEAKQKPNIIFILADDLGYADVGCYGQKLIKTPNIDQLAKQGTRFTQCYAGSTVCAPSRCALMTGYHTGHGRIRGNGNKPEGSVLQPGDVTVAKILKQSGYTTGLIGKWGLGNENTPGEPKRQGFDYSFGYLDQVHAHTYWTDHLFRNGERVAIPPKTYSHELFAQEALDFVKREHEKPFFLYLAFTIPHQKFDPPTDAPYSNAKWPQLEKNIAAMVTRMDNDIGKLMSLLQELNLENDTIVFFTSDNGPREQGAKLFNSSGPLRGIKRDLYDGGIREPMIVRWPGKVKPNATSEQIWAFWDFLPTAAEIAGATPSPNIDGISMLPAFLGKPQKNHDLLYWEFFERGFQQAIRMGDWKAVQLTPGKIELYDLKTDPGEQQNVADRNPDIIEKIQTLFKKARTESKEWPVSFQKQKK